MGSIGHMKRNLIKYEQADCREMIHFLSFRAIQNIVLRPPCFNLRTCSILGKAGKP